MRGLNYIRRLIVAGFVLLSLPSADAQTTRNLELAPRERPGLVDSGKYYAIVIGIDKYPPPLNRLKTAVKDATAVAAVLSKDYDFQVKLLLDQDATRVNILNSINQFRDTLNDNDSLLIYYAGHGYSDHAADKAYWLPVDADSIYSSNRIIADELTTDVRVQNARHVLIISDSCYSGGLARDADTPVQSAGRVVFLSRMSKSRSRTLMASGGDEPVSDSGTDGHSVFAYAVLRSLQQSSQGVFTASDLFYGAIRQQVAGRSDQLPQYSVIRNSSHDEGDFVFIKKDAAHTDLPDAAVSQLGRGRAGASNTDGPDPSTTGQTSLAASPPDSFVVLTAPVGAEIHIDQQLSGHSTGDPSRIKVQPGQRNVEVFLSGYLPWKQVVSVEPGKEVAVVASLAESPASHLLSGPPSTGAVVSDADLGLIQQLLNRYANAVSSHDLREIKMVWPEVPPKKLEQYKAIPHGVRITLQLTRASLLEGNENAIAKCKQAYFSEGKPEQDDNVTFYVGRLNAGWIINQIPSSN